MKKIFKISILLLFLCTANAFGQTADITDPNFVRYLKEKMWWTLNPNSDLIIAEAQKVESIDCSGFGIRNLSGIQYFSNLEYLDVSDNKLAELPSLSTLPRLGTLKVEGNYLKTLPSLENNRLLRILIVKNNQLTSLPDLSFNTLLHQIIVSNNQLTTLPSLDKLTRLIKIDAGNNFLTSLPSLDSLFFLQQLTVPENRLTQLPSLKSCFGLTKINVSFNALEVTPDVSNNLNLELLSLDRNFLKEIPNLERHTRLRRTELHYNYFTFQDLLPYASKSSDSFVVSPQLKFSLKNVQATLHKPFYLSSLIDNHLKDVSYTWYFNGTSIATTSADTLSISSFSLENIGSYYVKLNHPAFPDLTLITDSVFVTPVAGACPDFSEVIYTSNPVTCKESGSLQIKVKNYGENDLLYELKSNSGKVLTSTYGMFTGLTEPAYDLTISKGKCTYTHPGVLKLEVEECDETFITPNNDGDKDSYYFSQQGSIVIYDKSGLVIKNLVCPCEWDGSSNTGQMVPPGYYLAKINAGKEYVRISILY